MKKEEKLEKCRKIKIQEKIELKDVEMQADPCKGNNQNPCKHNCCQDCYDHTTSFGTNMY